VSFAITKPVEKVSGAAAGVSHAFASFKKNHDFRAAVDDAKEAATRRAQDLHEDLGKAGPAPPAPPTTE
jgi:hypothetical protein